jgi:predicted transcriptional regulator
MTTKGDGSSRRFDPTTSKKAARSVDTSGIKYTILLWLRRKPNPLNGWELSKLMEMPTITVVPRLAPLRRGGFIIQDGTRPGPSGRSQIAYVITSKGADRLKVVPPPKPRRMSAEAATA